MSPDDELLSPAVNVDLLEIKDDDDDADDLFIKPVKKHKILMLSDHQLAPSGVGVQSRFLIENLVKKGTYTFRCLGGAIRHKSYDTIAVNPDFMVKPVDGFGTKEMIRELLITERPDAMILFTDPRQFIWLWEMEDEIHQICPIIYWHVWDNDPFPKYNAPWYASCDVINCLSQKTYDLVKPNFPDKTNYIPHAFPKNVFFPMPQEEIDKLNKENFKERADWFKCLWVNRNAVRKMPGDVLAAWKDFVDDLEARDGHRKALLVMHTDPNDREGPNLLAITEELGLQDNVWFSAEKLDFPQMNVLHNLTDTLLNVAKNEGFGLSTLISLQCGKPIVALKTGGETSKVVDPLDGSELGAAIEPAVRTLVGSQQVPYIYEDIASHADIVKGLFKVYDMTDADKDAMRKKATDYVQRAFNFDKMIEDWDASIVKGIEDFKAAKAAGKGRSWDLTVLNPVVNIEDPKIKEALEAQSKAAMKEMVEIKPKKKKKKKKQQAATKKKRNK